MGINKPVDVLRDTIGIGVNKISCSSRNYSRLAVLSMLAGIYIAIGGILSVIIGFGIPEMSGANPGLQKLLSGCVFPVGLILVVFLGAELFTGNNALLIPAYKSGRYSFAAVVKNWTLVYFGNFAGALFFTYFFVYLCGLTAVEPYNAAVIKVSTAKVSMSWFVVFLKGIGANWFVCLGIWLGLSCGTAGARMVGCWLPVMAFVALGYEHSIANMFFIPAGMLEGADVTVYQFVIKNLIPATLGNIVGGAIFVGMIHWYLHYKTIKEI